MSVHFEDWHNPRTLSAVAYSVAHGWGFHSTRLLVKADSIFVASYGLGMSNERALTRDLFGLNILESARLLSERYHATNRAEAMRGDDVYYWVARDGVALALMRRDGTVEVNPDAPDDRRIKNALDVVVTALGALAALRADYTARGIEVDS